MKWSILARQGKLDAARELIRKAPERGADDARAKVLAEAGHVKAGIIHIVERQEDGWSYIKAGF